MYKWTAFYARDKDQKLGTHVKKIHIKLVTMNYRTGQVKRTIFNCKFVKSKMKNTTCNGKKYN